MGEGQLLRRLITGLTMAHLLLGPVQKQRALLIEELLKVGSLPGFFDACFVFANDIEVHQRQIHLGQLQALTQQPAIHPGLSPVQLPVVDGDRGKVAAKGFHLFQYVALRVITVGTTAHGQALVLAFKAHFGLIPGTAP